MESDKWKEIVDILDYAFQPIVNINTGVCIGHEALLRNFEAAGFSSIQEIFDVAYNEKVKYIIEKFRDDVLSLHDQSDREKGYIISTDREGNKKRFPLLCVSAAILDIPAGERNTSLEEIGESLAYLKKLAKHSIYKIASTPINGITNICVKGMANPDHLYSFASQSRHL